MSRTIKFITLGCKVNQYDTQSIREQFLSRGFHELDNSHPADIYVINTCTVTHKVDCESFSFIRRAKRENPKAEIIVTGCLTELDEDKIQALNDKVIIVKNRDKENILEYLSCLNGLNEPNGRNAPNEHSRTGITYFKNHTRVFLKIQDGCSNFCSYCKVPLVRGLSRSKPLDKIIQEARQLAKNGFKELVLCGICLGAYGKDLASPLNLVDALLALEKIDGLLRIRLSSIEAGDVSEGLVQKMAQSKKLCRHLHIPMQSGDDEILKKMSRNYKSGDYLNLIQRIKKCAPAVAITTDVMVGFPGENDENFQNTVRLIKEVLPLRTHIFPYSKREGTQAARDFNEKLDYKIIKKRIAYLKKVAQVCALDFKKQFLNKTMDVLIENNPEEDKGLWQGYTNNYIKVLVKSSRNLKNQFIFVKLSEIINDYVLADF